MNIFVLEKLGDKKGEGNSDLFPHTFNYIELKEM